MEGVRDPGGFEFELPVWTIVFRDGGTVPKITDSDGDTFVPIFTDSDLADRFIEQTGFAVCVPKPIGSANDLVSTLESLALMGAINVGIDATVGTTKRIRMVAIEEFVRHIRDRRG